MEGSKRISYLRQRPGLGEIPGVTRSDLKTLAWLAPLTTLASVWWIFRSTPCLGHHLQNQWARWFPTAPSTSENLYDGIITCDFWPEVSDHVLTIGLLVVIAGATGLVAARRFQQHSVSRAAMMVFVALAIAAVFSHLAFLPMLLRDVDVIGYRPAAMQLGGSVALALLGAGIAALCAWLTLKRRARG
jgi:hypothetical protein